MLPRVLDLLFPRTCCSCGGRIHAEGENGLCWDCRASSLPVTPPWCDRCGAVVAGRLDHHFTCARCAETRPAYDRARSLFRYEGGVRDAIHALKYHRDFSVIPDLALLLGAGLTAHYPELPSDAALVAVPLHPRRRRERGFNQGEEILRHLRRRHPGVPRLWNGLRRARDTETQTHLSAAARQENVRGAFRVLGQPPPTLVLFDDVMTTGATLDACCRALRRAGATSLFALTLARG